MRERAHRVSSQRPCNDGSEGYSGVVVPGHTASAYSNLADIYRLTITATSLMPDSSVSHIAFDGARIHCAW